MVIIPVVQVGVLSHRIVGIFSGSSIAESFESSVQLLDHIAKG